MQPFLKLGSKLVVRAAVSWAGFWRGVGFGLLIAGAVGIAVVEAVGSLAGISGTPAVIATVTTMIAMCPRRQHEAEAKGSQY